MREENPIKFDPSEIKNVINIPPFFRRFEPFTRYLLKMLDHIQRPLFTLFKKFGKPIGRWLGFIPETKSVRLPELFVETDDGAKMATDIYLPKEIYENRGKGPTIVVRMPYWKDFFNILGHLFASLGYVAVLQDIRGCAHSRKYGTNSIFSAERIDGEALLRWITKRFWYNGKIGMWGASYFGMTQLALASNPDGLVTCFNPSISAFTNIFWHRYGMYRVGLSGSGYIITRFITKFDDMPHFSFNDWDEKGIARRLYYNPYFSLYNEPVDSDRLKLSDLGQMSKIKYQMKAINSLFKINIQINKEDDGSYDKLLEAVFDERRLKHDHKLLPYSFGQDFKLNTPMLMVAGMYDMFFEEAMEDLREIQKKSPEFFKTNFKFIMGPWCHINPMAGTPLRENIMYLQYLMQIWWFDYWLKQDGSDLSKIPPIKVYVMKKKIWRNFNQWPPETIETKFYLHSKGNANTRFGDGKLTKIEPKEEPPDKYNFDPSNPVLFKGGNNLFLLAGAQNQIKQEARDDVLVYSTDRLKHGIEVIGEIKIVFYASSSAKDTDYTIKLLDVSPSGRKALNIVDSGVRARFRNGDINISELLEPGKIYKYELYIGTTSIYFKKNHRIRIEISSSAFPRYDVNSNLAGEIGKKKYIIANQTIYHDKEHPSHLILPVYKT